MSLEALISGWHEFKKNKYPAHKSYLEEIAAKGVQKPLAVITCIDPRLDLNWMTSQRPGMLTQHQTLGGVIPGLGRHSLGEEAYVQFVIKHFQIEHLAVVGHLDCALVKALLKPRSALDHIPAVRRWANLAKDTREYAARKAQEPGMTSELLLSKVVQAHTMLQVHHLMSYPVVDEAVKAGKLQVHPMIYDIGAGDLSEFSDKTKKFEPLSHKEHEHTEGCNHLTCAHVVEQK